MDLMDNARIIYKYDVYLKLTFSFFSLGGKIKIGKVDESIYSCFNDKNSKILDLKLRLREFVQSRIRIFLILKQETREVRNL